MDNARLNFLPFSSLLKDKFITGFIVICILLNGFVPRFSIQPENYAVLSQIMASQSVLLHFFSLSMLPEKIVSQLFKEQTLPQAQQKQQPAKQNANSTNSSSDFSIVNSDLRNNTGRLSFCQRSADFGGKIIDGFAASFASAMRPSSDSPLPGEGSVLLILAVVFFLLPRSTLSDDAVIRGKLSFKRPDPALRDRVFSLILTIPYRRQLWKS